ncbi:MAG: sulfite exporter TauE/SafE family protein [Gammaproteobacteria bacterium]
MIELLAYLATGALAGLLAGLLGIGGGLVIVPALAWLFLQQEFAAASLMHFAVGTSLATIVPISISSSLAHHRRGSVHWQAARLMTPGILAGAFGGAWLAGQISSPGLGMVFGVFEIVVAILLLTDTAPAAHRALPGRAGLGLAGAVIGAVSALLGIGGGTLTVPFLLWNRIDIYRAVGTAAACGLPIALAGAVGFAVSGAQTSSPPGLNSGYIYWPAVAGIGVTSVLLAPAGARLAHYLPRTTLQRVFALLLALVGCKMILAAAGWSLPGMS